MCWVRQVWLGGGSCVYCVRCGRGRSHTLLRVYSDSWSLSHLGYLYPGTAPVMIKLCYHSWSLSHLGYLYPGTTPVMIKLDHNRSRPWVQIAQVTKAPTII